jgi:hypothetical protein
MLIFFLYKLSREKEMGVMRNNEILDLVSSGDIEGLDFCIKKWHLQYNDVMIENAPILHCAVKSMQLPMIQFLISVGVDIHARNKVNEITTVKLE